MGDPNQIISGNNASLSVAVRDSTDLPNLKFTGGVEVATNNVTVEEAMVGQTIRIRVNVTNAGWTSAMAC